MTFGFVEDVVVVDGEDIMAAAAAVFTPIAALLEDEILQRQ